MIKQKSFSCKVEGKCDVSEDIKKILNNCNQHGEFINGKCKCKYPYIGSDCATNPLSIDSYTNKV